MNNDDLVAPDSSGRLTLRTGRVAYICLVVVGYALLVWKQLTAGLEFDEAINLTVVKNLATGSGFASNTNLPSGYLHHLFDPVVSTGPTLLVPSAVVWFLSSGNLVLVRLVPIAFFILYLVMLFVLTRRFWGGNAALVAISVPLLLNVTGTDLLSHGLSVGRFIGEFVVVALTVFAIYLHTRRMPRSAALVLGFAVLTKLNWFWMSVLLLVIWSTAQYFVERRIQIRSWLIQVGLLVTPVFSFEIFKYVTLGIERYRASTNEYLGWLSGQGRGVISQFLNDSDLTWWQRIVGILTSPTHKERLVDLFSLVSAPGLVCILAFLLVIVAVIAANGRAISPATEETRGRNLVVASFLIPGVSVLVWWLLGSRQFSARLGLPFWMLVLPLIGVAAFTVARNLRERMQARWWEGRIYWYSAVTVFSLAIAIQVYSIALDTAGRQLFSEQHEAASALQDSGVASIPAHWIWTNPELQVLTDLPTSDQFDGPDTDVKIFTSVRALSERGVEDATAFLDQCGQQLFTSQAVLICR